MSTGELVALAPGAFVAVQESRREPATPEENRIRLVDSPTEILPFSMCQEKVHPVWLETEAVNPD
jgi:hypothetical protein